MAHTPHEPQSGNDPHNSHLTRSGGRPPISIDLGDSQHEADEITELFLGEGSAVPASKTGPRHRPISEPLSVWKIVGRPEDLDEPAPERTTSAQNFDEIPSVKNPATTIVEAVVQGHLPVFAAAWVTQYARSRAEELRRAVVLLRLRQGHVSVECIMPPGAPGMSIPPTATLQMAIETARGMGAKHWIIQTDEVREPELWGSTSLNRITILTGGDEAALVACYRAMKGIAQSTDQHQNLDIHIAVMGVSPEKASHAIERVTRAGEKFLARHITGSSPASKIGAGTASVLFRSTNDTPNLAEVMDLLAHHEAAPGPESSSEPTASEPETAAAHVTREETVQREIAAMRQMLLSQPPHEDDESSPVGSIVPETEEPVSDPAYAPFADEPEGPQDFAAAASEAPIHSQQRLNTEAARPASLIDFIDDVDPLPIHCPFAGSVEFGVAQDGRLHLIAHVDGEANSGKPSTQAKVLEDLLVASAWALAHSRMLLWSHSSLRLGPEHKPVLHVVTNKPRESRRLLDTDIRVHLVVKAESERPWIAMELN